MLSRLSALVLYVALFVVVSVSPGFAQLPQIAPGLTYLNSSQNPDGTWDSATSLVDTTNATVTAVDALKSLNQTAGSAYTSATVWLQSQTPVSVDYIAKRFLVLNLASSSIDALIPALDTLKGAWGGYDGYETDILDTALALQALKAANYADQGVFSGAISYLTSSQNVDGGWGFAEGDDSNVYVTSIVSTTIQQFPQAVSFFNTLNRATNYLIALQNIDGGFGSPASTVHESALVYTALVAVITDSTVLGKAVSYLTATQSNDGSWLQDPYRTALAVQALHYSESKPTPLPPPPTTGTLTGKIISSANGEALAGVSVSLSNNPVLTTLTDSTGVFKLADVTQGSQQITLALNGYTTVTATTTVTAGTIVNLGIVPLYDASTTGSIQGRVTDASTRTPLAGVVISVTGSGTTWTTVTAADGTFLIVDITPGVVVLSTAISGYPSVTSNGTATAGGVLVFSPALSKSLPATTTGEMRGIIIDADTGLPISGAKVALTSTRPPYTTTTRTDGEYSIPNVEPGGYGITISASGYYSRSGENIVGITAGILTDWASKLHPAPVSSTIRGTLTDSASGSPIADADVSVTGTKFSAKTDSSGMYMISGINLLEFEIKASCVSYDSKTYTIKSPYHDDLTVDINLDPSSWGHVGITSLTADRGSYQAYTDVAITADVLNTDSLPMNASVSVSIMNAQGDVIDVLQGTVLDEDGVAQNVILFQPGIEKAINIAWSTGYYPPGVYRVIVKVAEDTPAAGTVVLAQRSLSFVIEPTQAISSLVLTPLPRFTNLGANEQIGLQTTIINHSNVPTEFTFEYTLKSPSGLQLRSGVGTISAQPNEIAKSALVESFPFTFTESGDHPFQVQIIAGPSPVELSTRPVSVAPGVRIEASQSLTPNSVIPDGDQRIRINIKLKGVEQK